MVFFKVLPKIAKKITTNPPTWWLVKQGTQTCVNKSIFSQRVKPNGDVFIKNTPKALIQEPKGATERFYKKNKALIEKPLIEDPWGEAEVFYKKNKELIEKLLTDKDGNITYRNLDKKELVELTEKEQGKIFNYVIIDGKKYREKIVTPGNEIKFKFEEAFKPFNEGLGVLIHGTDAQSYHKIMKGNFKINNKKFAESFHGIYATRQADGLNNYGEKKIKCLLNGKVATGDVEQISSFIGYPSKLDDYLINNNITGIRTDILKELFLKEEFLKRGYKGFYSTQETFFAKCKPVVIFDPKDLIIFK